MRNRDEFGIVQSACLNSSRSPSMEQEEEGREVISC
jgi:hypothetical protein